MNLLITLMTRLRALKRDASGQDLLEYALLVALIALIAIGAVGAAGVQVDRIFNDIASQLTTAG